MESTNDLDAERPSENDDRLTNEQTYDSALTTMILLPFRMRNLV